jgi:hypothetical protein
MGLVGVGVIGNVMKAAVWKGGRFFLFAVGGGKPPFLTALSCVEWFRFNLNKHQPKAA